MGVARRNQSTRQILYAAQLKRSRTFSVTNHILDDFQSLLVVKDVVEIKLSFDMVPKLDELGRLCFGEVVDKLRAAHLLVL